MKSTVGLGLRHDFHGFVLEHKPAVPFFEIITENYLYFDGEPRSFLKKIRELYPLAFHGVSLSIGSLEPIRLDYLNHLKKMIQEFQPLWVSDHLCWSFNGAENSHDLLPVPFTESSLRRIVEKTQQVQEFLGRKIYLENPSAYVDFSANEYLEEDFVSELCKQAGCGLLLDLNNLVVNQYNLGYDPTRYLSTIKNCEVKQIHLAGHTVKEKVRIDTHDNNISQEVLDLLPLAKCYWPEAQPMIEWDDKIPPIADLLSLRLEIEKTWKKTLPAKPILKQITEKISTKQRPSEREIHEKFWGTIKNKNYITESLVEDIAIFKTNLNTPAYIGLNVYSSAYYNRQSEVLEKSFPVLKSALNDVFNDVMLDYLEKYPSKSESIDFLGKNLGLFIQETNFSYNLGADKLVISDIANYEYTKNLSTVAFADELPDLEVRTFSESDWSTAKIKLKSEVLVRKFNSPIHEVVHSIQSGEIPEIPELKETHYVFYRDSGSHTPKIITNEVAQFLNLFSELKVFTDAIDATNEIKLKISAALLFENECFFRVNKSGLSNSFRKLKPSGF